MRASNARELPPPRAFGRAFLRGAARAFCRACAGPARGAAPPPLVLRPMAWATTAAIGRASALPRIAPRARPPHQASLHGPYRLTFPPNRAPWTQRRAPRSLLRYISRLLPLRRGSRRGAPDAGQFRFCPLRLGRSSGYFWGGSLPRVRAAVSGGAHDCAVQWRPPKTDRKSTRLNSSH